MKNITLALMLALFTSSCSHKDESDGVTDTPKFQVTASDVSDVSVKPITIVKTGCQIAELDVVFSGSRFQKFAKEHESKSAVLGWDESSSRDADEFGDFKRQASA